MEGNGPLAFAQTVEKLFKIDPRLVNFLSPLLDPSQFRGYAPEILKGDTLKEVLTLLDISKTGRKAAKIERVFSFFYTGDYPQIVRTDTPNEIKDGKFIKIIQSIIEDKQTPPAIPKIFLSFFNRKETHETIKILIKKEKIKVDHLRHFLNLVGCEVGNKKKEDKVNRVLKYLRPSPEAPTTPKPEDSKPTLTKEKEIKKETKEKEIKKESKEKETKKGTKEKATKKESKEKETKKETKKRETKKEKEKTPKPEESKKRKLSTGEDKKQAKKAKTDKASTVPPVQEESAPSGSQDSTKVPAVEKITTAPHLPIVVEKKRKYTMEDNESWKLWKEKKEAEISQKAKQTEDKRQKRDKLVLELEKLKKEVVVDESSYEASYQILKDLKKKYKDHIENCSSLPFDFQEEYGNLERFKAPASPQL